MLWQRDIYFDNMTTLSIIAKGLVMNLKTERLNHQSVTNRTETKKPQLNMFGSGLGWSIAK